jgi:hypothetical protein
MPWTSGPAGGTVVFVRNDCERIIEPGKCGRQGHGAILLVDPTLAAPGFGALSSTEWTDSVIC